MYDNILHLNFIKILKQQWISQNSFQFLLLLLKFWAKVRCDSCLHLDSFRQTYSHLLHCISANGRSQKLVQFTYWQAMRQCTVGRWPVLTYTFILLLDNCFSCLYLCLFCMKIIETLTEYKSMSHFKGDVYWDKSIT